ncbi:GNAT family N-acetyltransferase [Brachybacterium sp. AOP3-A1-3]|uniref:GNAT family N-acetyltransferase n=1 Tax=Brachybacterium sp. AOP3-A1-3 TaxID=3457699 RepID=UPI004033D837
MPSTIRPLTTDDAAAVNALLLRSPEYTRTVRGREVAEEDALEILTALPPRVDAPAKSVIGLIDPEGVLRGLCDIVTHWPEPGTAHIGLLLVDSTAHGRGLGRLLHDSVLAQLRADGGVRRLRAGVVATNEDRARGFWEHLGYRPTGGPVPYSAGIIESSTTILTRDLELAAPELPHLAASATAPAVPPVAEPAGHHRSAVHHLELWTADLIAAEPAWHWLLTTLGWAAEHVDGWEAGRIWRHGDGSYIVLEQSPDVVGERSERRAPGMNHIALSVQTRAALEAIRDSAAEHGWRELFSDAFPHAGGPDHAAWYAEDPEGIEVELVAPSAPPSSSDSPDPQGSAVAPVAPEALGGPGGLGGL